MAILARANRIVLLGGIIFPKLFTCGFISVPPIEPMPLGAFTVCCGAGVEEAVGGACCATGGTDCVGWDDEAPAKSPLVSLRFWWRAYLITRIRECSLLELRILLW